MNAIVAWAVAHKAVIWPIASALLLALFHTHTPTEWIALGETKPRTQGLIRLLRAAGLDPRDVLIGLAQMITGKPSPADPRDVLIAQLRAQIAAQAAPPADTGAPHVGPSQSGQRGSTSLGPVWLLSALALVALAAASSCHPRLPPISGCTPFEQSCSPEGTPRVCSASRRQEPAGDISCAVVGSVCGVSDAGIARCVPVTRDGGGL